MANKLDRTDTVAVLASLMTGNAYDPRKVDAITRDVGTGGRKLDAMIHAAAVASIHLSLPHIDGGHCDATRADKLVKAMPKGSRVNALKAWFVLYSNIRFPADKPASMLKPSAKGYKDADPALAAKNPFWTIAAAEGEAKPFDDKAILARMKALVKAHDDAVAAAGVKLSPANVILMQDFRRIAGGKQTGVHSDASIKMIAADIGMVA